MNTPMTMSARPIGSRAVRRHASGVPGGSGAVPAGPTGRASRTRSGVVAGSRRPARTGGRAEVGRDPALGRAVETPAGAGTARTRPRSSRPLRTGRRPAQPPRPGRRRTSGRSPRAACGRSVEALVVDLHGPHRRGRGRLVDVTVAMDLGVIAGALEQPVDDPGRAPAAPGDRPDGRVVDADREDDRRAFDDRSELLVRVEVEPIGGTEPVAQRAADPAGPRRGADHRERLEAEAERPCRRALADHDVKSA